MRSRALALAAVLCAALAGGASAATLNEAAVPGGAFGSRWNSPTEVGAGYGVISGTGSQNAFDNFVFTALPAGSQKLTLTFAAPEGIGYSYSAGASVLYADKPFRWGWDGTYASSVQIDYFNPGRTVAFNLGDGFSGKLYLALNFTHGSNLAYTIGVPSNAPSAVAPVPLPGGALLIASAAVVLVGLGFARLRPAA